MCVLIMVCVRGCVRSWVRACMCMAVRMCDDDSVWLWWVMVMMAVCVRVYDVRVGCGGR